MFTKCGQKENINYTFGMKKEETKQVKESNDTFTVVCGSCNTKATKSGRFCSACGEKL